MPAVLWQVDGRIYMEKKKITKLFFAWQDENEQTWLEQMALPTVGYWKRLASFGTPSAKKNPVISTTGSITRN